MATYGDLLLAGVVMLCPRCGKRMDVEYESSSTDIELDGGSLEYGCEVELFFVLIAW